jgi:hypothetical protein
MDKKYYLILDDIQKGPFTLEELKSFELDKSRLVWFEELEDWTPIEKIGELSHIIKRVPPPIKPVVPSPPPVSTKFEAEEKDSFFKTNKWYFIGGFVLLLLLAMVFFTQNKEQTLSEEPLSSEQTEAVQEDNTQINSSLQTNDFESFEERELSPSQLRQQLLEKEQSNPLSYLSVNGSMFENKVKTKHGTFFRSSEWKVDGYILEGYITNTATIASFKDITVRISFISSTGSTIDNTDFVVYDYVPANDGISYKEKIYPPEGTVTYEVSILSAKY